MRRFLRSTALAILFASVLPFSAPDIFVYKSAHAAATPAIPDWIKASCCGPEDVHHLRAEQVTRDDAGHYIVEGYRRPIPADQALPSQDGDYWIFYRDDPAGVSCPYSPGGPAGTCTHHDASQSGVYCFFVPMNF